MFCVMPDDLPGVARKAGKDFRMKSRSDVVAVCVACLALFACLPDAFSAEEKAPSGPIAVLDGASFWRVLESFDNPVIDKAEDGEEASSKKKKELPFRFTSLYPPDGWTRPEFDDSSWGRRHFFTKYTNGESDVRVGGGGGKSPNLRQLTLRGKFKVTDPAAVKDLTLSMGFRGGVVVYLNSREVARAFLPEGDIKAGALAEIYPERAFVNQEGKSWHWWRDRETIDKESYPLRVRRLDKVKVPAGFLKKGLNVLAVEIHATPYHEVHNSKKAPLMWATCGLVELHLLAQSADGLIPNVVRPEGVQVWNTSTAELLTDAEYGDPNEEPRPVFIAGARNGTFSGRIVVSSTRSIKGLKVRMSDLKSAGGACIAASNVRLGYGKIDSPPRSRWGGACSEVSVLYPRMGAEREQAVLPSPPDIVPLRPLKTDTAARAGEGLPPYVPGAIQSVWLMVDVPKDAAAAEYKGILTLNMEGEKKTDVPVTLTVTDWTLPDPADFTYFFGLIQSPEGVARPYNVELWSDKHWDLIGRSLDFVGKLGGKVLYIPLQAESQYGNAEAMVRWIKAAGGGYSHDFSRVEKYVDLALERMGTPQYVVVGVWAACGHVTARGHQRDFPRLTVVDAESGSVTTIDGPPYGTPESLKLWKPVLLGVHDLLRSKGLEKKILFGFGADRVPNKESVGVFHEILPSVGWQRTAHPPRGGETLKFEGGTVPISFQSNVWGGWDVPDPLEKRKYGWNYPAEPVYRTWLDRDLFDASPIVQFRIAPEQAMMADRRGMGQIGADFYAERNKDGAVSDTLIGRFPATNAGNLGVYTSQLLYPGPDGPVLSVPYIMVRENIQECEARIFVERAIVEKRLPDELAAKCQELLDERTLWHRNWRHAAQTAVFTYSGWVERSKKLYEAAAEVQKALATEPQP